MLKILLCDDDSFFLSLENGIIAKIIHDDKLDAAVLCAASSAAEILTFVGSNPGTYLIFIDLDFGESMPNGIDISSLLKQKENEIRVVFTTNHREMAMNILKSGVEPFGFIEKGTNTDMLAAGIRRYVHMALRAEAKSEARRLASQNRNAQGQNANSQLSGCTQPSGSAQLQYAELQETVEIPVAPGESIEIPISDILYLESEKNISHGITYHTVNGSKITMIGTLDAEAEKLGSGFLRVHRSYIAAKNQMIAIKGGYITLSNREEIPCSFKMRQEVRKQLGTN